MSVCITIPPEQFFSLKDKGSSSTKLDIINIILGNDCFDENKAIEKYNAQFKTGVKKPVKTTNKASHRWTSHNNSDRELVYLLNVLNTSNKEKVERKVMQCLKFSKDVTKSLETLLQKAIYYGPYIDLIIDVVNKFENTSSIKKQCVENYLKTLPNEFENLASLNYDNENEFCLYNKQKTLLSNKHKLFTQICEENDLSRYIDLLFNLLAKYNQQHLLNVIVTLLINMAKDESGKRNALINRLDNPLYKFNQKTKFMISDFKAKEFV